MNKGESIMKTAEEFIHYLNETGANIYEVSKSVGLGDTTLRSRLLKLGYVLDEDGKWRFSGDPEKEPKNEDVVSKKRMTIAKDIKLPHIKNNGNISTPNVHQALMDLDLTGKVVRTTITIQPENLERLREFSHKSRLRISDLYSLV